VDLDPTDAQALVEIGDVLAKRGDRAGAQQAYRAASDADPGWT
jgi:Flp pilus assembly protein TadD